MNKYMGFYELKSINLPTIPWKEFTYGTELDSGLLWTLRVAVETGADMNLPRIVGASADEAVQKGRELLRQFDSRGLVIYYPYFIADKSGVMEVSMESLVVEAVEKDLWNLVTHGRRNLTVTRTGDDYTFTGDPGFLKKEELLELERYAAVIRGRFRGDLAEGNSVLAEWSFAYNTDAGYQPTGTRYLVFYELRIP